MPNRVSAKRRLAVVMTEKTSKTKKAKKAKKADHPSVLASLPATRPSRIGVERGAAKPKPATARSRRPAPPTRPKPAGRTAKPPTRAPERPVRTPEPVAAGPRAVRAGSPRLETVSEHPTAPPPASSGPPSGGELVSTVIQAAGELAQIGLTVGGQIIRRAVDRLPKP